jgi:hypothetical protein
MAWTDACKIEAVAQIDRRKEHSGIRKAIRELSIESGIPYGTLRRWYYPESVPKNENTLSKSSVEKENYTTSDLHTLTYDSGRKKIFFRLCETDGNRSLVMQDYRIGLKGKEIPTKNLFIISMDFIPQFRAALDQVKVLTEERCPAKSGADDVSNLPEDDEAGPPATDDVSDAKGNEQEDKGIETAPDHAEGTSGNAGRIRCRDCRQYAPGKQLKDGEMNGSCKSPAISWDGNLFQLPFELHPCPNFSLRDQQQEQDMGRSVN